MKRFAIAIVLFVFLYVAVPKKVGVQAQAESVCKDDDKGRVHYTQGQEYGWEITAATKTAPPNPIVVGQDKEHRGVDIKVDIVSYPGSITYTKEVCTDFNNPQSNMASCDPYYKDSKYYYGRHNIVD
jgi:hypothetical protein